MNKTFMELEARLNDELDSTKRRMQLMLSMAYNEGKEQGRKEAQIERIKQFTEAVERGNSDAGRGCPSLQG